MGFLIGIDSGGTATKAAVIDPQGRTLGTAARNVQVLEPHPAWSERDMEAMWRDTCAVVREALAAANLSGDAVDGIACTGHGNGLYLIDAAGRYATRSTPPTSALRTLFGHGKRTVSTRTSCR